MPVRSVVLLEYPLRLRHRRDGVSGSISVRRLPGPRWASASSAPATSGKLILLPALKDVPGIALRGICTQSGLTARTVGDRHEFTFAATDLREICGDSGTSAAVVATRHHQHATQALALLRAGKHVFVEKPLCLTFDELEALDAAVDDLGPACPSSRSAIDRRFAPALARLRNHFSGIEPLVISYRFRTSPLAPDAWPQDVEVGGGRLIGEACHAIDACSALAGSPPAIKVYAEGIAAHDGATADDHVAITMRHENGSVSSIVYDAGGDRSGPGVADSKYSAAAAPPWSTTGAASSSGQAAGERRPMAGPTWATAICCSSSSTAAARDAGLWRGQTSTRPRGPHSPLRAASARGCR